LLTTGPLNLEQLDQAYVAIVQHFTQAKGVIHQVTLRPDKVHDGLIRLGETQGDELVGWNYPSNLHVLAILGTAHEEQGKWECRPLAI
jgi:hypothetical protein